MSRKWILAAILFLTVASAPVLFAPPLGELQLAWQGTDPYVSSNVLEHARAVRPYLLGRREALRDRSRGHLILKFWGMPSPARVVFYDLLRTRYAIRASTVGGCLITTGGEAEWAGYNDVMMREIEQRHGRGAVDLLWSEAKLVYQQRYLRK